MKEDIRRIVVAQEQRWRANSHRPKPVQRRGARQPGAKRTTLKPQIAGRMPSMAPTTQQPSLMERIQREFRASGLAHPLIGKMIGRAMFGSR